MIQKCKADKPTQTALFMMFHHCNGFPNDDNHWFILLAPPLARLRQGFTLYPWLTWNLLCRQADLNSQRSTCLFLNAGIKELCYCTQLYSDFWNSVIVWAQFKNSEICYITYKSEVCHKRMPMYGKKTLAWEAITWNLICLVAVGYSANSQFFLYERSKIYFSLMLHISGYCGHSWDLSKQSCWRKELQWLLLHLQIIKG